MQQSLWPGGSEEFVEGTIERAGGEIDWDNNDYLRVGYYWVTVQRISKECANITDVIPRSRSWSLDGFTPAMRAMVRLYVCNSHEAVSEPFGTSK
jgi:hypothetical protein